ELNASHLGVSGPGTRPDELTADLGLIFEEGYAGPGLKIAEVLKRGPADRRGISLKPGEGVTAIDGVTLTAETNLSKLPNGKGGEMVGREVPSTPRPPPPGGGARRGASAAEPHPGPGVARRRVQVQAMARDGHEGRDGQHSEGIRDLMYDRWVQRNAARVA